MSLASSFYSSLPLPRTTTPTTKQNNPLLIFSPTHHFSPKNFPTLSNSPSICNIHLLKPSNLVVRASESEGGESGEKVYEEYEVELDQPIGLKFAKGRDGGTYIDAIGAGGSADKSGLFTVGDKVIATSAMFGTEIWPAAEYGRTMYTIRQRIGPLFMRMQKRYGKMDSTGDLTEKEIIRAERNSGFISDRVREIQLQNALRKREQKQQREKDLREGLLLYKVKPVSDEARLFAEKMAAEKQRNEEAKARRAEAKRKNKRPQPSESALEKYASPAEETDPKRLKPNPAASSLAEQTDASMKAPASTSQAPDPLDTISISAILAHRYPEALPTDPRISHELADALWGLPKVKTRSMGKGVEHAKAAKRESLSIFYRMMMMEKEAAANAAELEKAKGLAQEYQNLKSAHDALMASLSQAQATIQGQKAKLDETEGKLTEAGQTCTQLKESLVDRALMYGGRLRMAIQRDNPNVKLVVPEVGLPDDVECAEWLKAEDGEAFLYRDVYGHDMPYSDDEDDATRMNTDLAEEADPSKGEGAKIVDPAVDPVQDGSLLNPDSSIALDTEDQTPQP